MNIILTYQKNHGMVEAEPVKYLVLSIKKRTEHAFRVKGGTRSKMLCVELCRTTFARAMESTGTGHWTHVQKGGSLRRAKISRHTNLLHEIDLGENRQLIPMRTTNRGRGGNGMTTIGIKLKRICSHVHLGGLRVACVLGLLLAGCSSSLTMVAPRPPEKFERLGPAKGTACGSLLIDGTAYNFIPILLNSRVERAYQNALQSVPNATALVNISMQESWFWWAIGSTRCVTITGEAIR